MKSTLKRELSVPETGNGELLWILVLSMLQSVKGSLLVGSFIETALEECDFSGGQLRD